MVWVYLLYMFLFLSLVTLMVVKSLYRTLTVLVFGEVFVSLLAGFSLNGANLLLSAFVVVVFTSITVVFFNAEYMGLREKIEPHDVLLPLLLTLMAVVLFYRVGVLVAAVIGYTGIYLAFLFYFESKGMSEVTYRKYYYLLKLPYPLLAPLALLEQFGFQKWVVPFVVFHYVVTLLWLKFDLPELTREPRIT